MHEGLSVGRDTGRRDDLAKRVAAERPAVAERPHDRRDSALGVGGRTPSWARRRAFAVTTVGAVSACSHG